MYYAIDTTKTLQDIAVQLSDGNPGAATALLGMAKAMTEDPNKFEPVGGITDPVDVPALFFEFLLNLDDMNIRGPRIWVVFNDMFDFDHMAIHGAVSLRSTMIVSHLNNEDYHPGAPRVVESGGLSSRSLGRVSLID